MDINHWQRLTHDNTPVYVNPDGPDWFLPNAKGDELLKHLLKKRGIAENEALFHDAGARHFIREILSSCPEKPYPGRGEVLHLSGLKECWFHLTDQCNLSCSHCMFSCSPKEKATMDLDAFASFFDQAHALGARTFFLTGGEPMIHPDFREICTRVLEKSPDTQLVILTNGLLIPSHLSFFQSPGLAREKHRIHFQVSMDGNVDCHDRIRGKGSFKKLVKNLQALSRVNRQVSLAMAVSQDTLSAMPDIVDTGARCGVSNLHYLWMFGTGNAEKKQPIPVQTLFTHLMAARKKADENGMTIDNIEAVKAQIFSPQGTRHDLGNAGWESLAIAPDGSVFPTPALIKAPGALCGNAKKGLETVWKTSPALIQIRNLSIVRNPSFREDPLAFLIGGGDLDHSFYNSGQFDGRDPYQALYRDIALWLMTRPVRLPKKADKPCILVRMGDRLLNCDSGHGQVALTHSNCVLSLSTPHAGVNAFYAAAAQDTNTDIVNPVCYPEEEIRHVPETARIRSYGCGSPVLDAGAGPGDTLVDLGSGAGMECFIAARKVGKNGKIFGIDMTDPMLALSRQHQAGVEVALGYQNIEFKKAFLENLPLADDCTDIVISNCVINLSQDKHRTFEEIFRILKPGGRLVISDIVTDTIPDPAILNDPQLRGECIAGALTTSRLMDLLDIKGFENIHILKRFFYRKVMGHSFFSITYTAYKPGEPGESRKILYPGPFAAVLTDQGETLVRGELSRIKWHDTGKDPFFILDENGTPVNQDSENACACYLPPEERASLEPPPPKEAAEKNPVTGCLKCGSPLTYFTENTPMTCCCCNSVKPANAMCEAGHFICDTCHGQDAFAIVKQICLSSKETDMIKILNQIRRHPAMPLHGPEHHFAVPGAIVSAYRNNGGNTTDGQICSAIERGKQIPGGSCGFWGGCGAALGVGIAFGVILESSPVAPAPRQAVQQVVGSIILELAALKAARCCQRETWTAMLLAAKMSATLLPIPLPVDTDLSCRQMGSNKECPGTACCFFKRKKPALFQTL